ncbi:MAG: 1-deoxy-D-xylulose-5-phosphate synthase, partial [Clostridiales bacterium]|nr:1-deoxy-D-xylulose-5-phosphate synthase [Clostridiales bacterium]
MLEKVKGIEDLKALSIQELTELSQDLRNYILSVVSQNGGHLASNLGVVELSVALEYVFDTRTDRLVWDVGHQSYTHKILTGRKESFATLRQRNGLSGFPKRSESICDPYDTGHSSTSIAAALGFAKARDLQGGQHKVIAVIGDGSMTGGQAFESLNLTAELDTDILVILNDNQLSIAANIGGLSHYLNRIRASSAYTGSKEAVRRFLSRIPFLGAAAIKVIEAIKDSLRYILVNGVVFTELGYQYYGPVDGHDIKNLIEILRQVKERKGPVILHVLTQKGKGYKPAVENATAFHGIAAFDRETGRTGDPDKEAPSYTDVFSSTLIDLAREDERILAVTAAMADGTGLERFRQTYPGRFFDIGIAEQTAVSYSTALALSGFRPVVAIYASFLQRAFDQMIQDTALQNAPLLFAIDRSGLVGEDGPTHHGVFALSYLNQIPNMRILLPRDEYMLRDMMRLAFSRCEGPAALLYPKGKGRGNAAFGLQTPGAYKLPQWGKGQLLRKGFHVLIIA